MRHVPRSVVVIAASAILYPGLSSSAPKPKPPTAPPVALEFAAPAFKPDLPLGVMYTSGTTLELKATIRSSLGILSHGTYVPNGGTGWIIFTDPDNCPEIGVSFNLPLAYQLQCLQQIYFPDIEDPENRFDLFLDPLQVVPDETYLQFGIDADAAGSPDFPAHAALADPAQSGGPVFLGLTTQLIGDAGAGFPLPITELAVGPFTGGTVDDGFGFGADDDLTGLVLLSNHGVGIVYQDADASEGTRLANFTPVSPRKQRNLAGFLESVSYELKSNNGMTVIRAGMILPDGLIAPILAVDNCIGSVDVPGECIETGRYRVDGGPWVVGEGTGPALWDALIPTQTFEVRAFLVNGTAPSHLEDLNGDGKVTAQDAKLANYKVISDEAVTRFKQFPGFLCREQGALSTVFGADFDGNGFSAAHIECPPGPGAITKIP